MKLLIVTQKIDKNDTVLGFFHSWVAHFAKRCKKVTVICLEEGTSDLPKNVKILSLGKERGFRRAQYIFLFFLFIFRERKNYDIVFVHMNQEYVLLGGIPWKLFGKKIWMWRNHPVGSFLTALAVFLSDRSFCTSEYSYTARFKKTELMPVGVDTEIFTRDTQIIRVKNSILFLGRISRIKNPLVFVDALCLLREKGIDFRATIVGDALPKEKALFDEIRRKIVEYHLNESVKIRAGIPNREVSALYNQHEVYVNLTPSGSLDKTILEAMACEDVVIVANRSFSKILPEKFMCKENNAEELAEKLEHIFLLSQNEKDHIGKNLRKFAQKNSLVHLAQELGF